jgi:ubiquinone/menaquinone biosynthesis C-methylase UbiE
MNDRKKFYRQVVDELVPERDAQILICGAGSLDQSIFKDLGYKNVTISNLDKRMSAADYAPYQWSFQNAEALNYADNSFDYVVIHAAIHHASSPHRVLTEIYRVAKKRAIAFESRDSLIMRLMERFKLTDSYEHIAVYYNGGQYGGVNNTEIPNYVYRWTEREIEKTISAFAPQNKHKFIYRHASAFPVMPKLERRGWLKYQITRLAVPFYKGFTQIFPQQQNLFAFCIEKSSQPELQPWLKIVNQQVSFDLTWGQTRYGEIQENIDV